MSWPLLAGLDEEQQRRVVTAMRRRTFRRQEVVFHAGDPADTLHVVAKGRFVARVATPLGDTAALDVLGPGAFFGEMALLGGGGARSATVAALEPGKTRSMTRADFERLRGDHPAIGDLLLDALAVRVRELTGRLLEGLYVPAELRVLRRLLALADGDAAPVRLTQEELAELAGTSRATVNRVLREAERRGQVELRRGGVVVRDAAALARVARVRA